MSIDLGHGSPICPPCRRRGALAPSPALASSSVPDRNPLRVASPQMDAPPPVNGSSPSVEARNPQEGKGFLPGLLEPTLREGEATPMKDGSTEIPNPDLEKDVAKQRNLSAAPPCAEGWSEEELSKLFHFSKVLGMPVEGHEVEILALLKNLKLRTGNTKVKEMSLQMVKSVSVGRFLNWASLDSRGAAGGLLLFWDNRVMENLEVESGVYGSVIGSEKEDFWEELEAIRDLWDDPWRVGRDFNSVRFPEEIRNAPSLIAEMKRFLEVIGELGLRDSPLTGGPFTWIGGLNSQAASRLDRFLISDQCEDHFSAITQSTLPCMVFDHSPIVLEAGGFSSRKSPFRFENMWLKIDGFKDLVRSWWNGYSVESYSSHCIAEKLKALKKDLKIWNKEVVDNVSSNRVEAFAFLQCWEAKEKENPLNPGDMEAKNLALEDYKK
uniref:Endonuclease/exonuclease/phosphatase domain-containing protein n=1 Tax=Vitis vinifera TaxID=29760 RepID=A5BUJ1_VITVI|nr:hypothetical protein VITISV_012351 [Vitis vinifera]